VTKINLITPPDKLYGDSTSLLLVCPSKDLQTQIQEEVFTTVSEPLNVYLYNKEQYTLSDVDWLLAVFNLCQIVIIDVDQCPPHVKDLLSFMIAKPKTYWLTNATDIVYTHISSNRIYNISTISSALGGKNAEDENTK
jgi:hypothetical protein